MPSAQQGGKKKKEDEERKSKLENNQNLDAPAVYGCTASYRNSLLLL